jgi:hypothetical protein
MRTSIVSVATLLAAALFAGQALAAGNAAPYATPASTQSSQYQSVEVPNDVATEPGKTLKDVYPDRFPSSQPVMSKSAEQVKAELDEAVRYGTIIDDEEGWKPREAFPERYPPLPKGQEIMNTGSVMRTTDFTSGS